MLTETSLTRTIGFSAPARDQAAQHETRAQAFATPTAPRRDRCGSRRRSPPARSACGSPRACRCASPSERSRALMSLEMRPVVLLLRGDVAVRLHFADDAADLLALERLRAGRGEVRRDALLALCRRLALVCTRLLLELEALGRCAGRGNTRCGECDDGKTMGTAGHGRMDRSFDPDESSPAAVEGPRQPRRAVTRGRCPSAAA